MRKSFTRFLGLFTLFCVLGFQVSLAGVKTLVPKDGESDAVKTTDLTLTFDNPVSKGTAFNTAAIQLKTSGGGLVDQINASDVARFTFSEDMKTITLDVQALLIEGSSYYVYFPADVLKENMPDGTTPSFAGYSQPTDWNFTVGDHSSPVLANSANFVPGSSWIAAKPFYPVSGQTDVGSTVSTVDGAFTSQFYVTFNESVKGNVGYIKIYEKATGEIQEIINANQFTALNSVVTFSTTKLRAATDYYILIDAGAFIDGSTSKNAFAGITSTTAWTFTTRSTSAPTVTASVISGSLAETTFNVSAATNLNGVFYYTVTTTDTETPAYTISRTITNSNPITIVNSGLTAGTKYYFYYKEEANGALRYFDLATNAKVADATGISSKDKLTVTTPDNTLPDLRVYTGGDNVGKKVLSPVNASVGVPADLSGTDDGPTLTMSFTEEVKAGTGSIIIYNAADNTVFESIDVTNANQVVFAAASVAIANVATPCWTAKIKLTNKLQSTKSYYVKLASGVIVDKASNKFAGLTVNTAWTFTAGDNVAPTVTWSTPSTTDKGLLQAGSTVSLTFSETLSSTTTTASVVVEKDNVIQTGAGSTDTFTVTVTPNSSSPTGYTVTGPWKQNSIYVIKVLANSVCDVSGNYITKELHKAYSTDSWVVPTSSFDPANGSSIATDKSIKVKFSENIALLGGTEITNANIASLFTVRENGGPLVAFAATWNYSATDGYYALITPTAPWTTGKSYTVSVSADYQDMNLKGGANSPSAIQTASYNVKDTTAPTVSFEINPSATVVDITSPDLKILFSETLTNTTTDAAVTNAVILRVGSATGAVVGLTVSQTTSATGTTQDYKVIPASPLKEGTTYYLAVADKAVADASGNKNVGNSTTFTTGAAPELVSVTPANETTNVVASTTHNISLTFAEAVKAGSVSPTSTTALILYTWDGSTWTPTSTTTAISQIAFVGNSATFLLSANLVSATKYSFSVVAGAVQDVDGNNSDAIAVGDYSFTTKDVTAPQVSAWGVPATNATTSDDNLGKAITITFDEKINRGSGTITIVGTTTSSTFSQSIDVNGTLVSISDDQKVVTVAHNRFAPANDYTIQFNAGSFKDLAGNNAAAWTQSFRTNDNQGPNFVAAQSFPLNGADKLALNSDLVIKFDENIVLGNGSAKVTLLKEVSGAWVDVQHYSMNQTNVTVSGNQINVALVDLVDNSKYGVFLEAGAVSDVVSGTGANDAIGTLTSTPWIFYTGDHNGPVATFAVAGTLDDDDNMVKVDRTANITITFDEAIKIFGGVEVTSANIVEEPLATPRVVRLALGAPIDNGDGIHMEASIDAAKKVITIPAATIFNYTTSTSTQQYTIFVSNVEDALGNDMIGTQSYTFWIDDYTAPVTTATITENTEGTQVVLSVTSDEKANAYYYLVANGTATPTAAAVKANGTLLAIADETEASEVTIPTSPETKYDLYVAAEDLGRKTLQSNATVEASKMTILTADLTAPVVTTYGNNGKTDINVSSTGTLTLTVTFGTDTALNSSKKAYVYNAVNGALVGEFSGSSLSATTDTNGKPRLLNILVPNSTLSSNGSYYINMDKGLVTDVASTLPNPNVGTTARTENVYAGLFDATTYAFKTKDTVRPIIKTVTPNKADDVLGTVDGNLVVTFTESVVANSVGAGDILINEVGGTSTTPTYTTKEIVLLNNSATTSLDGAILTINPVMNLTSSKEYQVVLKQDLVKDASGNTLSPSTSFNFVVKDVSVPTVAFTASSTTDELTKKPVLLDENLKITFSEKVVLLDGSIIEKADVDSLVSLTDASGKALAFVSTFIDREGPAPVWVIDPKANLKSNSTYTLSFGAIVMDPAGNKVPAQSVTFTTKLLQSPDIIFAPVNASVNIDQNMNITITSSKSLYQADPTGSVALGFFSQLENNELKDYVHLGTTKVANDVTFTATIDADKKVITIDPVIALSSGVKYYLTFKPLGFASTTTSTTDASTIAPIPDLVDEFNNSVVVPLSITNGTATITTNQAEFTVVDYVAPTLVSVSTPKKEYLPSTDKLEITLSEEVIPGTGDIKIYRKDGTLAETIAASAMTVKSDNKKVLQINPSVLARENNMEYYVIIPEGAIVDKSILANKFAGLLDNTKWIYKTADNLSPVVVSFLPAKGATNVGLYDNLAVYFDKDIALGSGIISIYKKGGDGFDLIRAEDNLKATVDPVDAKKLIINFDRNLDNNVEYYVTIEAGAIVNKSNPKSLFAGFMDNSTWTFSTESTTAPKVLTLTPADNATGVVFTDAITLKMTFDVNVAKGSGTVRVVNTATGGLVEAINISSATISGVEVSIPMTVKLANNTGYHVFVDGTAITNTLPSKVAFAGIGAYDVWNFTTSNDDVAPTAIYTPSGTTTPTTDNHPSLQMTFNEDVTVATGNVKIYKASDNTAIVTIPVTAAMLSGKTVSLTYAGGLDKNTNYYVLVDKGVVKDLTGNDFAGVTASTTWTFKTGADWATPVVPEISDSQFKVYPNPFVDYVTVSNASELSKVVVSNIAGQIVKEVVNPESTIQLNELRSGVYFISLYQDGAVLKTVKLLKR